MKFGNNNICKVKGYEQITNCNFIIKRVFYAEGLKHNLISVSKLLVGTGNQVLFDEEGSMMLDKIKNEVLLKSKRKGDMFTLDMNPIVGLPSIFLLSKASSNLRWLWHHIFYHFQKS